MKEKAFTMAEVLITLGIIGIIAALTIPQLIKNYQAKVYETAFKKSYSNISKAYLMTKNELGESNLLKGYAVYNAEKNEYPNAKIFISTFYKQIGVVNKAKPYTLRNYNNTNQLATVEAANITAGFEYPRLQYILADGSSVGTTINGASIWFFVDTNGPYKKPNRYGFDVFAFAVSSQDAVRPVKMQKYYTEEELEDLEYALVSGLPCTNKSKQAANGIGCSYYAMNDISPEDNKSSYWKNLPK